MGITWDLPDYTTLSRRARKLAVPLLEYGRYFGNHEPLVLLLDSSGFKIYGEGEWKMRKYGKDKRRTWREEHIAVDYISRDIVSLMTTNSSVHDSTQVIPLLISAEQNLNKIGSSRPLKEMIGDGAYDNNELYHLAEKLEVNLITPPQKNAQVHATIKEHKIYDDEQWRARNAVVKRCFAVGREEWKEEVGYHRRSIAETTFYRLKACFGDKLRSRTPEAGHTENLIRARLLNRFNKLGLPKYTIVHT
jgi:hypothetical protein